MKIVRLITLWYSFIFFQTPVHSQQTITADDLGYTKGSFAVSESGGGIYTVPITVATGASGMQPQLSLVYNSQGGNGLLGMGWSIAGLSVISRSSRTQAQDAGYFDPFVFSLQKSIETTVNFNLLDRYSLDGEALRLAYENIPAETWVNKTYGHPGTAYFTEQNTFNKIVLVDTINGSPGFFRMYSKDGLIYEYGNTPDSRIELASNNLPYQWLINRIEDRKGNFMNFKYYENKATGEYYPLKIEYSGNYNLNKDPVDSVVFSYEERPDSSFSYFKGSRVYSKKRLKELVSYSLGKVIRKYAFEYQLSFGRGRSNLVKLQECTATKCLTPTLFYWENGRAFTFTGPANNTIAPSLLNNSGYDKLILSGDFNGDGLSDIFTYHWPTGQNHFYINRYPGNTFSTFSTRITPDAIRNGIVLLSDFNADGKSDVIFFDSLSGRNRYYLADFQNNNLTFKEQALPNGSNFYLENYYLRGSPKISFQDFTNDGLPDMFIYKQKNGYVDLTSFLGRPALFRNQGNYNENQSANSNLSVGTLDFSAHLSQIGVTDTSFFSLLPGLPAVLRDSSELYIADLDNNSYPDFFLYNRRTGKNAIYYNYTKTSYKNISTSKEVEINEITSNWNTPLIDKFSPELLRGNDSSEVNFSDFNSDGLPDLFFYDKKNTVLHLLLNKGNFTFDQWPLLQSAVDTFSGFDITFDIKTLGYRNLAILDSDADGKTDICLYSSNSPFGRVWRNNGNLRFSPFVGLPADIFDPNKLALSGHFLTQSISDYFVIQPSNGSNSLISLAASPAAQDVIWGFSEAEGNGLNLQVSYNNLTDTNIYKRSTPYTTYPNAEFQNRFVVVDSTILFKKLGLLYEPISNTTSKYKYEGAKSNLNGRGFRGFSKITQAEAASNSTQVRYFYRDTSSNIYVGDPLIKQESYVGKSKVSESNYKLNYIFYPRNHFGLSFYAYTSENVSTNYDTQGILYNKTRTRQEVDYYGNITTMVVDHGNGFIDSTINHYTNDTAQWILGRLTRATLYRMAPGKPTAIKNSAFEYDNTTGQLVKEISYAELDEKNKVTKTYKYDGWGNITESAVTAWNGKEFETQTNKTEYDPSGKYIVKSINALGHQVQKEHDPYTGNVLSSTDANGLKTTFEYDALGRLKKQVLPDGNWDSYDYKYFHTNISTAFTKEYFYAVIRQSSLFPGFNIEYYDLFDRQIGTEKTGFNGKKIIMDTEFDGGKSLLMKQSRWHFFDEAAQYTTYQYDQLGRQIMETLPGNRTSTVSYFPDKEIFTNARSQTKTVIKNAREQVIEVIDNNNKSLKYEYDATGNLLVITDPKGNTITSEYDLRGNKTKTTDPDLGIYKYEYNGFNELIKQTDAAGNTIEFEYDKLGRLVKRVESEGTSIWTYDAAGTIGMLNNVKGYDNEGDAYIYDNLGRVIETKKTVDGKQYTIGMRYDTRSRLDTLIYPSGLKLKYIYNTQGYLTEVRRAGDNFLYWRASKVNALGMLELQEQANNVVTQYHYNTQTLLLDSLRGSNATRFFNRFQYKFDNLGNLLERKNVTLNKTESFEYDNLNRLKKSAIVGGTSVTVEYDDLGNIISKSDVGTYEYGGINNGPHRVVKVNLLNPKCIPSYEVKAEYASFNKVKKITNDTAALEIQYGFDRQRKLVKYQVNGVLKKTRIYVSNLVEIEMEGTKTRETNYIRGSGGVIATYTTENGVGKTNFWFKDHLGSVSTITDSVGNIIEEFSFDSWGKRRKADWTQLPDSVRAFFVSRGFTGHEHYDLFSLVDMNGRIYDPVLARFTSADPFIPDVTDLQAFNHYSYVYNNPLSLTDPSGFKPKWLQKIQNAVSNVFNAYIGLYKTAYEKGGKWVKENWKTIAIVTVVVATTIITGGAAGGFWAAVLSGAAAGFAGSFTATMLYGGTVGDAFKAGAKGAAIGAVSAGLTYGVGSAATSLSNSGASGAAVGVKVAGHGLVQGGVEKATGGKFAHGFYSGAISGAYGVGSNQISESYGMRVAGAATVGGTTSVISGGKFSNGAVTGAYVQMFNEELHGFFNTETKVSVGFSHEKTGVGASYDGNFSAGFEAYYGYGGGVSISSEGLTVKAGVGYGTKGFGASAGMFNTVQSNRGQTGIFINLSTPAIQIEQTWFYDYYRDPTQSIDPSKFIFKYKEPY